MTRWARSGSTQKHKKVPGEATKWGEFDNQYANKFSPKKKKNLNNKSDFSSAMSNFSPVKSTNSPNRSESASEELKTGASCKVSKRIKLENDGVHEHQSNESFSNMEQSIDMNDSSNEKSIPNKSSNLQKRKKKNNNAVTSRYSSLESSANQTHSSKMSPDLEPNSNLDDSPHDTGSPRKSCTQQKDEEFKKEKHSFENDAIMETTSVCGSQNKEQNLQQNVNLNDSPCEMDNTKITVTQQNDLLFKKQMKNMKRHSNIEDKKNSFEKVLTLETHDNEISPNLEHNHNLNDSLYKADNAEMLISEEKKGKFEMKTMKEQSSLGNDMANSSKNGRILDSAKTKASKRKERFLLERQKRREQLGILYLPPKIEEKLRNIRKTLKQKGFPPELQKSIMRKERRNAENEFRKEFVPSKPCFICREIGHQLANCPKNSDSLKQQTGICFKCGSTEHRSGGCPEEIQGFPFATCFICKEQGHITRECPKNKKGIYPKGGGCALCGNVNHLKNDCPSLRKKKNNDEPEATYHIMSEGISIDEEVIVKEVVKKEITKKPKIVKF